MQPQTPASTALLRPKFRRWRRENEHSLTTAAEQLGVSEMQVQRYERPFGDPTRAVPRQQILERIFEWTGGQVTPADFYPPHLNGADDEARP